MVTVSSDSMQIVTLIVQIIVIQIIVVCEIVVYIARCQEPSYTLPPKSGMAKSRKMNLDIGTQFPEKQRIPQEDDGL